MRHLEGFSQGADETRVYYQSWLPENDVKGILLIVHGLAEHSGRYMNVVNHFVPLGYGVYGIDHIGHGKSDGTRVFVNGFEDFTNTLKNYFDMIQEWQPQKPIFLVGHSMGGLICSIYLLDHQAELAGSVISGPSVKVSDNISSVTIFFGKVFSILMPKLGLVRLEADGLSRDPAVVEAYVSDPLVSTKKVTARLGAELLKAMQRITGEAGRITLPVLIVQGGADRLVDPSGAQMLYDLISSEDKTLKIYEGLYHEVVNEPEYKEVLRDVEAWLDKRIN